MSKLDDFLTIKQEIERQWKLLAEALRDLVPIEQQKANTKGDYEMKLAQTMLRLRNKAAVALNDEPVEWKSIGCMEKIAKGIIYRESITLDLAESAYKRQILTIGSIRDKISALQSILRYQE